MRFFLLALLITYTAYTAFAQHNLSGSITKSALTYVYAIHPSEAESLVRNNLKKVNDKYLHSRIDSFSTFSEKPTLRNGNYLLIHASGNKLVYQLYAVGDLQARAITNDRDLGVVVHTRAGSAVTNAKVYVDGKQINYDVKNGFYGPWKKKKAKVIKVIYENIAYFFPVTSSALRNASFITRAIRSFPLKYVVKPVKKLFTSDVDYSYRYKSFFNGQTNYEKKYRGFIVFSKPKYKPGDTVRIKAFVTSDKGKHVNRKLLLRISDEYLDIDTILSTISPYGAGGYEYQFVLTDSMDIDLDETYLVTLEELQSRKYDLDEYDGNLDDDEYALKRKVLARGKFDYEEYELQSVTFTARSSKDEHHRGEELAIFMKAVDENEMPVLDGRVEVLVQPYGTNMDFYDTKVFIPDTLWFHTMELDNVGETKLIIPDSIFPPASFEYRVHVQFLNSNNEVWSQSEFISFYHDRRDIGFDLQQDTLNIRYLVGGKSIPGFGRLLVLGRQDTIQNRLVTLPVSIRVNPFATKYQLAAEGIVKSYSFKPSEAMVSCMANRTTDSIHIMVVNPNRLPLWYTIFSGKKVVLRGHTDSLDLKEKVRSPKKLFRIAQVHIQWTGL